MMSLTSSSHIMFTHVAADHTKALYRNTTKYFKPQTSEDARSWVRFILCYAVARCWCWTDGNICRFIMTRYIHFSLCFTSHTMDYDYAPRTRKTSLLKTFYIRPPMLLVHLPACIETLSQCAWFWIHWPIEKCRPIQSQLCIHIQ